MRQIIQRLFGLAKPEILTQPEPQTFTWHERNGILQSDWLYARDATGEVIGVVTFSIAGGNCWKANAPTYYRTIGRFASVQTAREAVEQWVKDHPNAKSGDRA